MLDKVKISKRKLKGAVIGCGVIGNTHAWSLSLDPDCVIVWACDLDLNRAKSMQMTFSIQKITHQINDILQDPNVDFVTIATPHYNHSEILDACLRAGKHVLCEKPLGINPDQVKGMLHISKQSPKISACVFQHRFAALSLALHSALKLGKFGDILSAGIYFRCKRTKEYYESESWRGRWYTEGGGLLINQCIHAIDLLSWFLGRPQSISANMGRDWMEEPVEIEDWVRAKTKYEHFEAVVDAANVPDINWDANVWVKGRIGSFQLNFGGEHKLKEMTHPDSEFCEQLLKIEESELMATKVPAKECYGATHPAQIKDFTDAIRENRNPKVSIEDGALAVQMVFAMYHSAANKGIWTQVPPENYTHPRL